MVEARGREKQIINERIRKIDNLRKEGINPYPTKFDKKHWTSTLQKKYSKLKKEQSSRDNISYAGRLMTKRSLGKISFGTLQDSQGKIQVLLQKEKTPKKDMDLFKKTDSGDFIGVKGNPIRTKRGELSILVEELTILAKSIKPLPEKWHGIKNKEERYRKRYLDLIMNPEVMQVFIKRHKVIDSIRKFLVKKGYIEVETPILQPIYGGTSAKPFESELKALKMKVFMRVSDELYLKRLIAGGYEKVFEFCKDFRNEGIDSTHNPEFTLLETMCAYADYKQNMDLVEEIMEFTVKEVCKKTKINYQGKEIDFKRPWRRISMVEAISKYAGLEVEKMSDEDLKNKLIELKIQIPFFKRGIAIEEIFGELVEDKLIQPTIVYDFPYETCGLAKPKEEDPRYAERFEPYVNGWELGNIYSELNDPRILEEYWKDQERMSDKNEEAQKLDEDFLNALKIGMPPTSGVGLGIDRLVMLLTDQASIRDVIFFPFMKPEEKEK